MVYGNHETVIYYDHQDFLKAFWKKGQKLVCVSGGGGGGGVNIEIEKNDSTDLNQVQQL